MAGAFCRTGMSARSGGKRPGSAGRVGMARVRLGLAGRVGMAWVRLGLAPGSSARRGPARRELARLVGGVRIDMGRPVGKARSGRGGARQVGWGLARLGTARRGLAGTGMARHGVSARAGLGGFGQSARRGRDLAGRGSSVGRGLAGYGPGAASRRGLVGYGPVWPGVSAWGRGGKYAARARSRSCQWLGGSAGPGLTRLGLSLCLAGRPGVGGQFHHMPRWCSIRVAATP